MKTIRSNSGPSTEQAHAYQRALSITPLLRKLLNDSRGRMLSPGNFGQRRPIGLRTDSIQLEQVGRPADSVKISGCVIPYGKISQRSYGGGQEVYERGCFGACLKSATDIAVLFNHDPDMVLGRTRSGTAVFYEDSEGLQCEVDPPGTSWADDLIVSMDRGDIDQLAAAFYVQAQRTEYKNGQRITVIQQAQLMEASVSTFPMFDAPGNAVVDARGGLAAGSLYLSSHIHKGQSIQ